MNKLLTGGLIALTLAGCTKAMPPANEKVINMQEHIRNTYLLQKDITVAGYEGVIVGTAYNYKDSFRNSFYVTAGHCVDSVGDSVKLINGEDTLKAICIYKDSCSDYAQLKGEKDKIRSKVKFGNSTQLLEGEELFRVGYPNGMLRATRKNTFCGHKENFIVQGHNAIGGESGSPIFAIRDDKPYLVGILSSTGDKLDVNLGVDINTMRSKLNKVR